jgi:hypothetical protein
MKLLEDLVKALLPTWTKLIYSLVIWLLILLLAELFLYPCLDEPCAKAITDLARLVYDYRKYLFFIVYLITAFSNL